MAELYGDMPSTPVYNGGDLLTNDSMGKMPWANGGGNDTSPGSNAGRRKSQKNLSILRRKGGGKKRMR